MFALAASIIATAPPSGGSNRRDNITDQAAKAFCSHYGYRTVSKPDIFHYIYALLHHPAYRERFAENLKRELPRLGNRSAIRSDPNRPDQPDYIVRLMGQVIRLRLETIRIVNSLPPSFA